AARQLCQQDVIIAVPVAVKRDPEVARGIERGGRLPIVGGAACDPDLVRPAIAFQDSRKDIRMSRAKSLPHHNQPPLTIGGEARIHIWLGIARQPFQASPFLLRGIKASRIQIPVPGALLRPYDVRPILCVASDLRQPAIAAGSWDPLERPPAVL